MKKKLLSMVLALCLVLCLLPAGAAANEVMGLVVNDVDVSSVSDMTDVLGDGTVRFDADSGVLTLTDAHLTKGLSDPARAAEEHPAVSFGGQLTIHLRGSNVIDTGTDIVMGQALRNSAIFGDALTITAEPGATLEVRGMVQVQSYTQTGGTVSIEMDNSHGQITKWALYVMGGPLQVSGGTLAAASTGGRRGGAIGLDNADAISILDGAVLTEGDRGFDQQVSVLTFSDGLMPVSRNYVKIEAPEGAAPEPDPIPPAAVIVVVLSPQNLSVNGQTIDCMKYNIDGSNYFKLRDLAMLLNGTGSQFDVGWDGEKGVVSITTRHAYTVPDGHELELGADQSGTAVVSSQTILIDGAERGELSVYNIGGSNFFKLRDLGDALGFDVDYDAASNTAIVRSK